MRRALATGLVGLTLLLSPALARADLSEVARTHIAPRYDAFALTTRALADTAESTCRGPAIQAAYQTAFDAWMDVSHIQFSPIEDEHLTLATAYCPDPKNRTGRALAGLFVQQDPVVADPQAFAEVSVAAQGVFALKRPL
ncbi:MAG: imelysin family protein [Pseudomonadota bacterium]